MLRLFAHAKYDFIAVRRYAYAVTALFIIPGVLFPADPGPELQHRVYRRNAGPGPEQEAGDVASLRSGLDREGLQGPRSRASARPNEFVVRAGWPSRHGRQRHPGTATEQHRRRMGGPSRSVTWGRSATCMKVARSRRARERFAVARLATGRSPWPGCRCVGAGLGHRARTTNSLGAPKPWISPRGGLPDPGPSAARRRPPASWLWTWTQRSAGKLDAVVQAPDSAGNSTPGMMNRAVTA